MRYLHVAQDKTSATPSPLDLLEFATYRPGLSSGPCRPPGAGYPAGAGGR